MQNMYAGIANSPGAVLNNDVGAAATIIPVSDVSAFPAAPSRATIGTDENAETIVYAAKTANALSGCTRGVEGVAQDWVAGTPIARNFTNGDYAALTGNITELAGDMEAHATSTDNPHGVTKSQVGLGNVDNTSDADKPISAAAAAALATKTDRLNAPVTYYVNAVAGADTNDGLSSGTALQTIMAAIDKLPKDLNGYSSMINIAAGDYDELVTVNGFNNGQVVLFGTNMVSTNIAGVSIVDSNLMMAGFTVKKITNNLIMPGSGMVVASVNANVAIMFSVAIDCAGYTNSEFGLQSTTNSCVTVSGSFSVSNCSVDAIKCSLGSQFICFQNITGSGNRYGLLAEQGGRIVLATDMTLTCTSGFKYRTQEGGMINVGGTIYGADKLAYNPSDSSNDTSIATTSFVKEALNLSAGFAPAATLANLAAGDSLETALGKIYTQNGIVLNATGDYPLWTKICDITPFGSAQIGRSYTCASAKLTMNQVPICNHLSTMSIIASIAGGIVQVNTKVDIIGYYNLARLGYVIDDDTVSIYINQNQPYSGKVRVIPASERNLRGIFNGYTGEQLTTEPAGIVYVEPTTYAPTDSPAFTGTPTVPTAAAGTNTTQAASTEFVNTAVRNADKRVDCMLRPANISSYTPTLDDVKSNAVVALGSSSAITVTLNRALLVESGKCATLTFIQTGTGYIQFVDSADESQFIFTLNGYKSAGKGAVVTARFIAIMFGAMPLNIVVLSGDLTT